MVVVIRKSCKKKKTNYWGEGMYRSGEEIKKKALMPPHSLTNFEIQNYYKNEPKFNGVYSRDNLSKIKNGTSVINLDEYANIGIH